MILGCLVCPLHIWFVLAVILQSAIGYIAPEDKLADRAKEIYEQRDANLEAARDQRRLKRQE